MNDAPMTKGDMQTILDHITSERQKLENYIHEELEYVHKKLDKVNNKKDYVPIRPDVEGGIHSDVLGLDFHIRDRRLAVYDPVRQQRLQTRAEQQAARAETAEARAETAEARAAQETITRQKAEAEVKHLREQLARSK